MSKYAAQEKKPGLGHHVLTVLGTVLCVILTPVLIINCILLVKGYTNSQKVPDIGGVFPLIVLSDSMYPVFSSGDLIICRTLEPEEVQVGDVIAYFDPESIGTAVVSHRVTEVTQEDGQPAYLTKGDANNAADRLPVPGDSLIGVYSGTRIPGAGSVAMFMQSTAGLVVCVLLPLVMLVAYDALRRRSYEKRRQSDKDQLLEELEELRRMKAEMEQSKN